MNGRRLGWLGWILAVVAIGIVVAIVAFDAGLSAGHGGPAAVGRGPFNIGPFGPRRIPEPRMAFGFAGWHGLLGLLVLGLLIAGIVVLAAAFVRGRPGGPSSNDVPPEMRAALEAWHRQAHGVPAALPAAVSPTVDAPPPAAPASQAEPPGPAGSA